MKWDKKENSIAVFQHNWTIGLKPEKEICLVGNFQNLFYKDTELKLYTGICSRPEMFYKKAVLKISKTHRRTPVLESIFYLITAQKMKFSIKDLFSKCAKSAGNCGFDHIYTAWKVRRYGVSLRIQSECRIMRTRITPNTDTFYAVLLKKCLMENFIFWAMNIAGMIRKLLRLFYIIWVVILSVKS